jgi:hypothetical protein
VAALALVGTLGWSGNMLEPALGGLLFDFHGMALEPVIVKGLLDVKFNLPEKTLLQIVTNLRQNAGMLFLVAVHIPLHAFNNCGVLWVSLRLVH